MNITSRQDGYETGCKSTVTTLSKIPYKSSESHDQAHVRQTGYTCISQDTDRYKNSQGLIYV